MVPEASLEQTEDGLVPKGDGWFVANARWYHGEGRSAICDFEGDRDFTELGINLNFLEAGVSTGMYHWEADQEDFLVLAGECRLLIEGQERLLKAWDFVHCPAWTEHVFVGAGDGPCVLLAVGTRSGGGVVYPVSELAQRYGAGVQRETSDVEKAYEQFAHDVECPYRDGWLPVWEVT